MNYNIEETFRLGLEEAGQDFTIYYRTSTSIYSGGGISDPYYGTKTIYNISTGQSGLLWSSTAYVVRGIINKFSKGLQYIEDATYKWGIHPLAVARATFWANDLMVNVHSFSGPTYLTNCHTVICMGESYRPKNQTKIGYGDEYVIVSVLDKI